MAEYETLIREALLKHGTPNAAMRFNIYAAARQVVENSFADLPGEMAEKQRVILEQDIANIESSYINVVPTQDEIKIDDIDIENPISADLNFEPELEADQNNSGKNYLKIIFFLFFIFAIFNLGYLFYPAYFKDAQNYAEKTIESFIKNFNAEQRPKISQTWLTVFDPKKDLANINTPGGSLAQLNLQAEKPHVMLLSIDSTSTSDIEIKVPKSILASLTTKTATFEFTVGTQSTLQEFSIACNLQCKKQTFTTAENSNSFMLDVSLIKGEQFSFLINTDLSGKGRSLELYSIRVQNSF